MKRSTLQSAQLIPRSPEPKSSTIELSRHSRIVMKKQKAKHRRKHGKSSRNVRHGMQLFQHPFSRMDPEVLKAALLGVADQKIEEFPKLLDAILQLFREKYPPHILSVVAGYSLQSGVSQHGVGKRLSSKIEQHHVEVLQALALMLPKEEWGQSPAAPGDMQSAFDTIDELADAFHYRRFKAMEEERDEQARAMLSLQERVRLHTQAVRNGGSYSQVIRISTELSAMRSGSPHPTSFRPGTVS